MKTWSWSVASLVFLSQPAVNNGKYLIRKGGGGGEEGGGLARQLSVQSVREVMWAEKVQLWFCLSALSDSHTAGLRLRSEALHLQ